MTQLHSNFFEYQPTVDLNVIIREYGKTYLNDEIPAPPDGFTNIKWQTDSKGNISAYGSGGGGGTITPIFATTNDSTITGSIPGSVFVLPSLPNVGSLILDFNGQILTPTLGYTQSGTTITVTTALEDGDELGAHYLTGAGGGGGGGGVTFVSSVLAPTNDGNFQVSHTLGKTPTGVIIEMTSGGQIWFQSPTLFDSSNIYLVASDAGLTGFALAFG